MIQKRYSCQTPWEVIHRAKVKSSGQRLAGGTRGAFLALLLVVLLGCGVTKSSFVPSGGYVPRPPTQEILVYFEGAPPSQPYNVVGMVYAEKEADTGVRWDVVNPGAVIELLKAEAQVIGAEAIIDVRVTTLTDRGRDYKKGEAKAIIFTKQ